MILFNLDIDETVESGVDDLQRIQIDDVEDTQGDAAARRGAPCNRLQSPTIAGRFARHNCL